MDEMAPPPKRPQRTNQAVYTTAQILAQKSPITKADLPSFLASCIRSWSTKYSEDQKRALIQSFPPAYRMFTYDDAGNLQCPLNANFCFEDSYMREATVRFQREVAEGYYEAQWQNRAKRTMQDREEGKFDAYTKQRMENDFGECAEDDEEESEEESDYGKDKGQGRTDGRDTKASGGPIRTSARRSRARGVRQQTRSVQDDNAVVGEQMNQEIDRCSDTTSLVG